VANRFGTWREAIELFLQRPLLGWGPGCYTLVAKNEPGHPHADNLLLTVAAEQGVVGLFAWLWLMVAALQMALQSRDPARFSLLGIAIHQLFDNTVFWPWPGMMLMLCLALVAKDDPCSTT
jgi:O-antigen ligase